MSLKELLSQNPAAKAEYDAIIAQHSVDLEAKFEAGKKSVQAIIEKAAPYANSTVYPSNIKAIAIDVMKGAKSAESLETAVAVFDALKESGHSAAAQGEQPGATPAQQTPPAGNQDGSISNPQDFAFEIAKTKNVSGVEVR